jgi:hypothetical protein
MCFSAPASFAAGATLSVVGVATIRMTSRRSELPFAAVPLLFGVQQLIEGLIWLSFSGNTQLPNATLTLVYSLFSHVLWPVFIPFAIGLLETVPWRRKAMAVCQVVGLGVGLYLLFNILRFPIISEVLDGHVAYLSPHFYVYTVMALYLIATCVGLLSSHRIIQGFSALLLATFVAAYVIHVATFFSVWCFFAALLSVAVYFFFGQERSATPVALPAGH